jgi:rhodanese-related sulfurtransferase
MKQHAPRFLAVTDQARTAVREITPEQLLARLARGDTPAIVDVREDREWDAGRVPGAVHLGKGVIERDVEGVFPDPATELILYCGGGFRSALAARSLQEMGYTNAWSLAGGERGWKAAGGAWTTEPPTGR